VAWSDLVNYSATLHAANLAAAFFGPISHPHVYTRVANQIVNNIKI